MENPTNNTKSSNGNKPQAVCLLVQQTMARVAISET